MWSATSTSSLLRSARHSIHSPSSMKSFRLLAKCRRASIRDTKINEAVAEYCSVISFYMNFRYNGLTIKIIYERLGSSVGKHCLGLAG